MTVTEKPPELNPELPPPDPARVALLLALDWPADLEAPPSVLFDCTVQGREMTGHQRTLLAQCGYNDIAAMLQLTYEELQASAERVQVSEQIGVLLKRYGFGHPEYGGEDDTMGACQDRMTPEDSAEMDRLCEIAFPDGYMHLESGS